MLHYAAVKVADIERSGRFYDSILAPLGWRRQEDGETTVSWGFNKPEFYVTLAESQRPGYGIVSFPARSIPAVKASYESGMANGGESAAEPGSQPAFGSGNYAARMLDPDGYEVELIVAPS
ncbi:MAG: VOC family protein [Solirubrobacterales bacterium]|jgi:catechol 2,3-dioxygenase-like lactoylglutathione lyase family enzyme